MIKLYLKGMLCVFLALVISEASGSFATGAALSFALVFVVPGAASAMSRAWSEMRWRKQSEMARIDRANADEYAHQLAMRRERERLEMQAEVRISELISTLEAQFHMDQRKMEQLAKLKADFASRQQTDMRTLLGQLEAMREGAR